MYQVLMVKDEPAAADTLRSFLTRYGAENGAEFNVTHYDSAVPLIKAKRNYDLIFMDIDLPGINGMEAAELMRTYDQATPLVFVTNLAQYAVHGYEVDALDFIVKPVSYYHFSMRMDKAMRAMARNRPSHVAIATRSGLRVVPCSEVVYVETKSHNLFYHLVEEDEPVSVRGSLTALEQELGETPFTRISSSCLVNMDHVRSMQSGEVRLDTGEVLYASRAKKKAALETFADYLGESI